MELSATYTESFRKVFLLLCLFELLAVARICQFQILNYEKKAVRLIEECEIGRFEKKECLLGFCLLYSRGR